MSALFIGNDSCPLHIAAAVGTPAVGIFGPSNYEQFRPIGKHTYRQRVVHSNLPCSPCFHFIGNDAPWVPNTCYSFACMKAISSRDVIAGGRGAASGPSRRVARERPGPILQRRFCCSARRERSSAT